METRSLIKKIWNVISTMVLYLFLAICLVALVITILARKDQTGAAEIFGYRMLVVASDSMAECEQTDVSGYEIKSIPIRSMVFVQSVPKDPAAAEKWYGNLEVGDVLTFRYVYATQVTITHRITSITPKDGGYVIHLAGDNKNANSDQLTQVIDTTDSDGLNYVLGKVVGQSYPLGFVVSLLQEPVGLVLIVIVPCCIVITLEIFRIVNVVGADKRRRMQEEQQQKDDEIEELKRRLAALEKQESAPLNDTEVPQNQEITPMEEKSEREDY
ncbi:MAG: hypothetical protein IJX62_07755 [Clostridia bacterium]|nr:hypothetical protein [Clostridia bacterium]